MSHSDRLQDALEKRLEFAWKVLNEKGRSGAFVRDISPEILGIEKPSPAQSRTVGMTMKAMLSRGMVERIDEIKRYKHEAKWRAVDKKQWKPVNSSRSYSSICRSAPSTAIQDQEQARWYYSVIKEVSDRKRFRAKMANRL